ncbi:MULTISPECIES: hypothetical protein [Paenibacillus]|uniref:hypothetical protein n=1 Tax=Paenibacillus TaxID=44249 RepID=UPI000737C9CF|nr:MULTISPECIES: hypothetical protein [Paenibacillus]
MKKKIGFVLVSMVLGMSFISGTSNAYGLNGIIAGKFSVEEKPTYKFTLTSAALKKDGGIVATGRTSNIRAWYNSYDENGRVFWSSQSEVLIEPGTTIVLSDGSTLSSSEYGEWEIKDESGSTVQTGKWDMGGPVYKIKQLKNGKILFAGSRGAYQIFEPDMTPFRSGMWSANAVIYDAEEMDNGNILLVGTHGNWSVINNEGEGLKSGRYKTSAITSVARLSDGNLIAVTTPGSYILFNQEGTIIGDGLVSGKNVVSSLRSVTSFPGNHVVVRDGSKVHILKIENNTAMNVYTGKTIVVPDEIDNKTTVKISDNKIFFGGKNGVFQILEVDLTP